MAILAADTPNPFSPKNDEVEIKKEEDANTDTKKKEGSEDRDNSRISRV